MKRRSVVAVMLAVIVLAAVTAWAASVERYVVLWPESPNKSATGVYTDSTAALCAATLANWADLSDAKLQVAKLMIGAAFTKSGYTDTVDFILRASTASGIVVTIDTDLAKVATGAYQQQYTFADSADFAGMQYVQLLARIGDIDSTNAVRTQDFDVVVGTYDGLNNPKNRFMYKKTITATVNE